MATVSLTGNGGSGTTADRPVIPGDTYRMKCIEASIKDNTFEKPNKDGTQPQKLSTVWEITQLTQEQEETADELEQEWTGLRFWKDFAPYYGDVREGGPSKLKEFIDGLREQGHLEGFDPDDFDPESLVGIEQKVTLIKYTKTMGPNTGAPGNKIAGFSPLKVTKKNGKASPAPRVQGDDVF